MEKGADWIDFQPHKQDLTKVLGDLEADIMKSIWELQSGNVKQIHEHLNKERKAAITTVATVLDRLYGKGLVERELVKEKGIRYEYKPAMTRIQFETTVVRNIFKGLFESFGESAINYLIENTGIQDQETIEELKRNIEKLKEEAE
ncbi:MAG: BlaI/MecI/CopY family transcriptional regulator [Candidatus Bathyarchaeota archaeon]|nr:BlaI/MecI/CopY family transcriptional regulator [Candidatus Bathyarchaeota archaeon]